MTDTIPESPKFREEWLTRALHTLIDDVFIPRSYTKNVDGQCDIHDKIRVTMSFPNRRATSAKNRIVGQTFHPQYSKDGTTEIFVSPYLDSPMAVIGVLTHELCHVVLGSEENHGSAFKQLADSVGLKSMNGTVVDANQVSKALTFTAEAIISELGPYPHASLRYEDAIKKQGTRLLKAICKNQECPSNAQGRTGYTVRITKAWAVEGAPICGICDERMTMDEPPVEGEEGITPEPDVPELEHEPVDDGEHIEEEATAPQD